MKSCDLCSQPLAADARDYSAAEIRTAVKAGLRPEGAMADMAAAMGMSKAEMQAGWVQQVMSDSSNWSVCPPCAARIDRCLGNRVAAGASLVEMDLPAGLHVASTTQRLGTVLVDAVVVLLVGLAVASILGEAGVLPRARYPGDRRADEAVQNIFTAVLLAYWIVTEGLFGRTLGKLVSGTRVIGLDGSDVGWGQAALRTLSRIVPFEFLSLRKGVMWHDRWTKTRVVRAR